MIQNQQKSQNLIECEKTSNGYDEMSTDEDEADEDIVMDANTIKRAEKPCAACTNGDLPTDAHKCAVCDVGVHVFEEGYNQWRICLNCKTKGESAIEDIIWQRETEKWGVLQNKQDRKKTSAYIRNYFQEIDFEYVKKGERTILKNANSITAKVHTINGGQYSLVNT